MALLLAYDILITQGFGGGNKNKYLPALCVFHLEQESDSTAFVSYV